MRYKNGTILSKRKKTNLSYSICRRLLLSNVTSSITMISGRLKKTPVNKLMYIHISILLFLICDNYVTLYQFIASESEEMLRPLLCKPSNLTLFSWSVHLTLNDTRCAVCTGPNLIGGRILATENDISCKGNPLYQSKFPPIYVTFLL